MVYGGGPCPCADGEQIESEVALIDSLGSLIKKPFPVALVLRGFSTVRPVVCIFGTDGIPAELPYVHPRLQSCLQFVASKRFTFGNTIKRLFEGPLARPICPLSDIDFCR